MKTSDDYQRDLYERSARIFADFAEKVAALAEAFQAYTKEINRATEVKK